MTSVSRKEGFQYGFYIFAYWLVLLALSGALVATGGWMISEQPLGAVGTNREGVLVVLGAFVALLGMLVFGSGQVGLVYKVVADGVGAGSGAGNAASSGSVEDSEGARVGTGAPTDADEDPAADAGPGEATDTGRAAGDRPGAGVSSGDDAGEAASAESESPADVVSESEIADELGFASGDETSTWTTGEDHMDGPGEGDAE
jgi:hypothetical protein